jgi:hypothetical protein
LRTGLQWRERRKFRVKPRLWMEKRTDFELQDQWHERRRVADQELSHIHRALPVERGRDQPKCGSVGAHKKPGPDLQGCPFLVRETLEQFTAPVTIGPQVSVLNQSFDARFVILIGLRKTLIGESKRGGLARLPIMAGRRNFR